MSPASLYGIKRILTYVSAPSGHSQFLVSILPRFAGLHCVFLYFYDQTMMSYDKISRQWRYIYIFFPLFIGIRHIKDYVQKN